MRYENSIKEIRTLGNSISETNDLFDVFKLMKIAERLVVATRQLLIDEGFPLKEIEKYEGKNKKE